MSATDLFTIVTPTLNSESYLDETIYSVVTQAGDFSIRYHVQDGGSNDGTLAILESWRDRLAAGHVPICCRGVTFSFTVSKDGGMYQALNRAFANARPSSSETPTLMAWINSDDRLAAGACSTILAVSADHPEVAFFGSRVSLINGEGASLGVNQPVAYDQAEMAAGRYDGRRGPFIMQEGAFWTSALWDAVGGLDESFRLAGDWDLWRRFAAHAPLVTVDSVLGFHRRRPGQLTEQMDRYYAEIERALLKGGAGLSAPPREEPSGGPPPKNVARYNFKLRAWERIPDFGAPLARPVVHAGGNITYPAIPVDAIAGAGPTEGPYPEWNLPAGVFWMNQPQLVLSVDVPFPGAWTLVAECRNLNHGQRIIVRTGEGIAFDETIEVSGHRHNILLRVPLALAAGRTLIEVESLRREPTPNKLYVLIIKLQLEIAPQDASSRTRPTVAAREQDALAPAGDADAKPWEGMRPALLWSGQEHVEDALDSGTLRAAFEELRLRRDAAEQQLRRLEKVLHDKQSELNILRLKDAAARR